MLCIMKHLYCQSLAHAVYLDFPEIDSPGPEAVEFGVDSVIVAFQWTRQDGTSYILDVVPQANHNITFLEAIVSVQIQVLYNTVYNVSIKSSLCGQVNASTSFFVNFSES